MGGFCWNCGSVIPPGTESPFRHLRITGLRRRYSTQPPHGTFVYDPCIRRYIVQLLKAWLDNPQMSTISKCRCFLGDWNKIWIFCLHEVCSLKSIATQHLPKKTNNIIIRRSEKSESKINSIKTTLIRNLYKNAKKNYKLPVSGKFPRSS